MSFHHENVIWQSPDMTWNLGFYERIPGNTTDPDYDAEWDDDFDHNAFQFVSTGHPTSEAARRSWKGSNPGSSWEVPYCDAKADEIERLEDLTAKKCEAEKGRKPDGTIYLGGRTVGYQGPPKSRTLKSVKRERDAAVEAWASDHVRGYIQNLHNIDTRTALDARIEKMLPQATDADRDAYEAEDAAHRQRLLKLVESAELDRVKQAQHNRRFGFSRSVGERMGRQRRAEEEIRELITASEASARKRQKQHKKSKKSAESSRSSRVKARPAVKSTGFCGKRTRSGAPCRNSSNCPVHG
ncbi:hypothetical protein [Nesterenkonia rhizosphaerae]|uniref:Uncharacterized protein n=1 Tax=Nesterenkonia rhizosphaerae TaxID=1348272 RepID=A0ABP9G0U4_9MICC